MKKFHKLVTIDVCIFEQLCINFHQKYNKHNVFMCINLYWYHDYIIVPLNLLFPYLNLKSSYLRHHIYNRELCSSSSLRYRRTWRVSEWGTGKQMDGRTRWEEKDWLYAPHLKTPELSPSPATPFGVTFNRKGMKIEQKQICLHTHAEIEAEIDARRNGKGKFKKKNPTPYTLISLATCWVLHDRFLYLGYRSPAWNMSSLYILTKGRKSDDGHVKSLKGSPCSIYLIWPVLYFTYSCK